MSMLNVVSIVIPTYNRAGKIIECLESIVTQSYPNIEIIVVDDGSSDSTEELINNYIVARSLSKKLFYHWQENKGAPEARNNGLTIAKGKYVVFFDSDDIMLPERIAKQVSIIESEDSDSCACGFANSTDGKQFIPNLPADKSALQALISWNIMGSTQCWLYKREILISIGGYDVNYACYQDWDLSFRYLVASQKVSLVKEALSIFSNEDSVDRITSKVSAEKRIPHIQRYNLKVLKWLAETKSNFTIIDDIVFSYVNQITLGYYRKGLRKEAFKSYHDFIQMLSSVPFSISLRYRFFFLKNLIKRVLAN